MPHREEDLFVHLARTWRELATFASQPPNPLAIVDVLNRVSHRNWHFVLWFDEHNANHLTLNTDPALTLEDVRKVIDGTVPELFLSSAIEVRLGDGTVLVGDVRGCIDTPPADNRFVLKRRADAPGDVGITLCGFFGDKLPAQYQNDVAVAQALRARTWFGCKMFASYGHEVLWQCVSRFGCTFGHRDWMEDRLGADVPRFRKQVSLMADGAHIGNVLLATSRNVDHASVFHGRYGYIDTTASERNFGSLDGTHWLVELEDFALELTSNRVLAPYSQGRKLLDAAKRTIRDVMDSPDFTAYRTAEDAEKKRKQANRLRMRQEKAQKRSQVAFGGEPMMCVPSCETEVISLLSKLEASNALPLAHFQLVEYTPREGIDALAHFQISETSQRILWGPIELEYTLGNFFLHEHPVEQVSMIVCWEADDEHPLDPAQEGLYRLKHSPHNPWVLVLSQIPGIEIRE